MSKSEMKRKNVLTGRPMNEGIHYSKAELEAFRVLAHKGPVPNCKGCEAKVKKAWTVVGQYFTAAERTALSTAASHAKMVGEGRGEWDRVMGAILDRLNVDSEAVPRGSKPCSKGVKAR